MAIRLEETLRTRLSDPLSFVMTEFLDEHEDRLLDDYVGRVIDNNDPDELGRCRIRVFGIYGNDVSDKDIPWAFNDKNFVGSTIGSFIVPPVGTLVGVYFEKGDIYFPHFTDKIIDTNTISKLRGTDYPDSMVFFELDEGDYLVINRRIGEMVYKQRLGVKIVADEEGEITIHSDKVVRIDAGDKVVIGPGGGYVVTSPTPGQILTKDGHVLTATKNVRA